MGSLILINGGIGAGKTELVQHLIATLEDFNWTERRCKDKLFELTAALFNLDIEDFFELYSNRTLKETPLPQFKITRRQYLRLCEAKKVEAKATEGMVEISIRDAMIFVSEVICKPSFGVDYFGRVRVESMEDDEVAIDDSAGFDEEIPPAIEKLGQQNILIIRVHGRGSFENDSRKFLSDGHCYNTIDVWNQDSEEDFQDEVTRIVERFLTDQPIIQEGGYDEIDEEG